MKQESIEYYRRRARAECEAALNATSPKARHAHAELANAYQRLVEVAELEQSGELPPGKVASMAEALRDREDRDRPRGSERPVSESSG